MLPEELLVSIGSATGDRCRWSRPCLAQSAFYICQKPPGTLAGKRVGRRSQRERFGAIVIVSFYKDEKLQALSVIPNFKVLLNGLKLVDLTPEFFKKFAVGDVHSHVMPGFPPDLSHSLEPSISCLDKDFEALFIRNCSKVPASLLFCPENKFEAYRPPVSLN